MSRSTAQEGTHDRESQDDNGGDEHHANVRMPSAHIHLTTQLVSVILSSQLGDDGGGDTPVPIPNTTVKPSSADGTWTAGSWESRTLPGRNRSPFYDGLLFM